MIISFNLFLFRNKFTTMCCVGNSKIAPQKILSPPNLEICCNCPHDVQNRPVEEPYFKPSVPSEVEKIFSLSHRRQQNLPNLQPNTNLASVSQEKQFVSIPNAKSQTSSKRSKHSGTSSIASSVSRVEEARMELELARFQKAQNQERMKEEEMRRQEAEMRRKEEEMRCCKTISEDERHIKAAEFKATLLEARDKISSSSSGKHSYHDVTQSYMKNVVNIPQKSSVPTVSKILNRADSSS